MNFFNLKQIERVDRMTKWAEKKKMSLDGTKLQHLRSVSGGMDLGLRKGSECWGVALASCSLRKGDTSAVTQLLHQGPHQPVPQRGEPHRLGENSRFQPRG